MRLIVLEEDEDVLWPFVIGEAAVLDCLVWRGLPSENYLGRVIALAFLLHLDFTL